MRRLYIDTETTGLDPTKHAIHQIAARLVVNGEEEARFVCRLDPFTYPWVVEVEDEALAISGRTMADLTLAAGQDEVFGKFIDFLNVFVNPDEKESRVIFAGYNTPFDRPFVQAWFDANEERMDAYFQKSYRDDDVLDLARHLRRLHIVDTPNTQLGTMCKHYGIPHDAHDADGDIAATIALHRAMAEQIGGRL